MAQLSVLWSTPLAAGLVVLGAIGLAVAAVCPSALIKGRHPIFGLGGGGGGGVGGGDDEEGLVEVCPFTILYVRLSSEFPYGGQRGKCYNAIKRNDRAQQEDEDYLFLRKLAGELADNTALADQELR